MRKSEMRKAPPSAGGNPYSPRSKPARYPPAWPREMRADVVAAFLDYETTGKLSAAITRGEAPRPTATRLGDKGRREPVWSYEGCCRFIANRHGFDSSASTATRSIADEI